MSQNVQQESSQTSPGAKHRMRASSQNEGVFNPEAPRNSPKPNTRHRSQTTGSASFNFTPAPESIMPIRGIRYLLESTQMEGKQILQEQDTFGYFRRHDTHPKLQRMIFYALNQRHLEMNKGNLKANKVIQDAPVKGEKSRKNMGIGGKLNALLRTKKQKRTRTGIFHSLHLAIHDYRSEEALLLLETLSDNTLVKKRPKEANRAFLHAMVNRMTSVCLQMLGKGFPVNINHPVMGPHDHTSAEKFYFPSYFQMAVSFELIEVIKAMIKLKADVNLSWYQVTPLQNACVKGNEQIIKLLIENGASPNQSLGLGDYLMLSKLKPRFHRVASPVSSNSPQTPVTRPESLFNTKDFPHQAFQKTPLKLEKDYIEDKHIYLFELAALRGHTVIASYLLDQYYRLTRTNSKMVASSQFALLAADDYLWAKQLLRAGVKLTQKDPGGSTPLHLAARRGKLNLVITYVLAGANIHEKGMNGWTPLHEAAGYGHVEVVHYLIHKGADVASVNNQNETARDVARNKGYAAAYLDTLFANSPNIEIVKEKEKAVMNAEPPAPLSLSEGIKTKHEKGKFTPLAFLNRDKSTDRAASLSGSTTSLNTKSAPKKSFFAKTKGNPQ